MKHNKFVWWYTKPRALGISIGGWLFITAVLATYVVVEGRINGP